MRQYLGGLLERFLSGEVSLERLGWELLRLGGRIFGGEITASEDVRAIVNELAALVLDMEEGEATEDDVRAAVERALGSLPVEANLSPLPAWTWCAASTTQTCSGRLESQPIRTYVASTRLTG